MTRASCSIRAMIVLHMSKPTRLKTAPREPKGGCRRGTEAGIEQAAVHFAGMLFSQRMRTAADRAHVVAVFARAWGRSLPSPGPCPVLASPDAIQIGWTRLPRSEQGAHVWLLPSAPSRTTVGRPLFPAIVRSSCCARCAVPAAIGEHWKRGSQGWSIRMLTCEAYQKAICK